MLIIPHLAFARVLPDGSRGVRAEKICLDFAVINALGPDHWADTADLGGKAAESYDTQKKRKKNVDERCKSKGLRFWPVVFEQQGGMTKQADTAIRSISQVLAMTQDRKTKDVRAELLQRIAIVIARSVGSRVARRARAIVAKSQGGDSAAIAAQRHVDGVDEIQ